MGERWLIIVLSYPKKKIDVSAGSSSQSRSVLSLKEFKGEGGG